MPNTTRPLDPYFNTCPLCTHRPPAVTVRPRYLGDRDLAGAVEYRRGPRGGGPRVTLAWCDLCLACADDLARRAEEASFDLPEADFIAETPYTVGIDWELIALSLRQ